MNSIIGCFSLAAKLKPHVMQGRYSTTRKLFNVAV